MKNKEDSIRLGYYFIADKLNKQGVMVNHVESMTC